MEAVGSGEGGWWMGNGERISTPDGPKWRPGERKLWVGQGEQPPVQTALNGLGEEERLNVEDGQGWWGYFVLPVSLPLI